MDSDRAWRLRYQITAGLAAFVAVVSGGVFLLLAVGLGDSSFSSVWPWAAAAALISVSAAYGGLWQAQRRRR